MAYMDDYWVDVARRYDLLGNYCPKEEEKENPMDKPFKVGLSVYEKYADAEANAKRRSARDNEDVVIWGIVAVAKAVVPDIKVEKFTLPA